MMRKLFALGFGLILILSVKLILDFNHSTKDFTPIYYDSQKVIASKDDKKLQTKEDTFQICLSFVGDLMCHKGQLAQAYRSVDSIYDFLPSFAFVAPFLQEASLTFGNLETVFASPKPYPYATYPTFNTPDAFAYALKSVGFDFLFTANNHSWDYNARGVKRTIEVLDSFQIFHTGTFADQMQSEILTSLLYNQFKISLLAFTDVSNAKPDPALRYMLNRCDTAQIGQQIRASKSFGADLVLVHFHFGSEYETSPNKRQKFLAQFAIDAGADLVIGDHPHVLQPFAFGRSDQIRLDSALIVYSLGNFISGQSGVETSSGAIVYTYFSKTKDKVWLDSVRLLPVSTMRSAEGIAVFPSQWAESSDTVWQQKTALQLEKWQKAVMLQQYQKCKRMYEDDLLSPLVKLRQLSLDSDERIVPL